MRRIDREMTPEWAYALLDQSEYAVLSMVDTEGVPYAVPMTIARDGEDVIIHCANAGYKLECLKNQPKVALVCVGRTKMIGEEYTTAYESVIVRGEAHEVTEPEEKERALRCLCMRHAEAFMDRFEAAIARHLPVTCVFRIRICEITGKCRPTARS